MTAAIATSEENTMVRVLEDLLNQAQPDFSWEVMNFGVSGSATGPQLVLYQELVRRYQPDVVIVAFFTGNDLADNSRRLTQNPYRYYFDLDDDDRLVRFAPLSTPPSAVETWLNRHSRLWVWQKSSLRRARRHFQPARKGFFDAHPVVYWSRPTGDVEQAWQLLEKVIERLNADVTADGSTFVVAVLPTGQQMFDELWGGVVKSGGDHHDEMDLHYPEQRLRNICDRLNVPLVTMLDRFLAVAPHRSRKRRDEWLHINGNGHFNDAGNRLAAEILNAFLSGETRLETEGPPSPPDS